MYHFTQGCQPDICSGGFPGLGISALAREIHILPCRHTGGTDRDIFLVPKIKPLHGFLEVVCDGDISVGLDRESVLVYPRGATREFKTIIITITRYTYLTYVSRRVVPLPAGNG